MLFIAIITFIAFTFITYKKPILALAALSALLPTYLLRFEILGLPSTILEVIIWAVVLGWLTSLLSFPLQGLPLRRQGRESIHLLKTRLSKIKWPLGLLFIASIIAIFIAPNFIKSLGLWRAFFLESILIFLLILAVIRNKCDFEKIIFGLSLSAVWLSIFAIGQRFFGLSIPPTWQSELRVTSLYTAPNELGLYLGPLVMLFVYQILQNLKSKKLLLTTYYSLLTFFSLSAMIFAQSDGAIFAIIGAGFLFILLNLLLNKKYKSGVMILLLVFIAGGVLFGALAPIQEKILLKDWSGQTRMVIWQETWNMLKDNPIFGVGLRGYKIGILPYHESRDWMEVYPHPHNIFLNFWSELGLLGLAAFIWLLERFAKMCYKVILSERKSRTYIITAICAMAVVLIHGLVDVQYFKNDLSILFWIIFSMPLIAKKT